MIEITNASENSLTIIECSDNIIEVFNSVQRCRQDEQGKFIYFCTVILPIRQDFLVKKMNKTKILDDKAIARALARITHEIIEKNEGVEDICLMGVKTRGVPLAEILSENIAKFEGKKVPVGTIDTTIHRDDISNVKKAELADDCYFPCAVENKTVILVDDVLYTGRTVRAAIEAVFAYGRPDKLQLAVLIDRGHRELPIKADYVGKNVPTSIHEKISVKIRECDGESAVYILKDL